MHYFTSYKFLNLPERHELNDVPLCGPSLVGEKMVVKVQLDHRFERVVTHTNDNYRKGQRRGLKNFQIVFIAFYISGTFE